MHDTVRAAYGAILVCVVLGASPPAFAGETAVGGEARVVADAMQLAGLPAVLRAPAPRTGITDVAWVCKQADNGNYYWFNCSIVSGQEVCTQSSSRCSP